MQYNKLRLETAKLKLSLPPEWMLHDLLVDVPVSIDNISQCKPGIELLPDLMAVRSSVYINTRRPS